MENSWNTALWLQFGAAIDMLENALVACPDSLWNQRLWREKSDDAPPSEFAEFWYLSFHTLFWLDLYLSGMREEEFAPPAPFTQEEQPERPYTKEELRGYLASLRQKCHTTLVALTDEQARRPVEYPWIGKVVSFFELQLYSMRHVQEHAAQLSLLLGQHAVSDEALDWVPRAKGEPEDSMTDNAQGVLAFYQGWENYQELLIKALTPLTPEQIALRPAPHLRSIGETVRHMIGARARWGEEVLALGDEAFAALGHWDRRDALERSAAELVSGLRDSWRVLRVALQGWTPADLDYAVPNTEPEPGIPDVFTRQWVIWHLIEHDLHHGGEISLTLGMHHLTAPDL